MNVLIIFTDQQHAGTIENEIPRTPNLDRLASEGTSFANATCAQTVCTPSRGSLLTGVYPHTHGCVSNCMVEPGYYDMRLPKSVPTIAELLNPHGHVAGYVGKWHLGDEVVPQHGFEDYWISAEDEYIRSEDRARLGMSGYYHYLIEQGYRPEGEFFTREETAELPEEHSRIAFIARNAERFLEENRYRDFVLTVNFLEPHPPYHSPNNGMYSPDEVALPANFHEQPFDGMPERARLYQTFTREYTQSGEGPMAGDEAGWRSIIARYYGLTTLADDYIGGVLNKLDDLGIADNTLVVFTSDHGDMMGGHGMLNKCVMYDDALGLHAADHLEGECVWPVLTGERIEDRDKPAFSEWNHWLQWMHAKYPAFEPWIGRQIRTARTARWKLNVNEGDLWELYDLKGDPGEMENRIDDPSCRGVVEELLESIRAWQKRTSDRLELPERW